jgi:glycine/D-amino acid oxidase-like deaminating enzyme
VERVVVVGGGVLGTMHAVAARRRGLDVVLTSSASLRRAARASATYAEPFAFDVHEDAYDHLRGQAERLLGTRLPRTERRWAGVYSQVTGPELYHRSPLAPGVVLVTGPGGRGMTCAPAIAEETFP